MAIETSRRRFRRERSPLGYLVIGTLIAIYGLGLLADNLGFGDIRYYIRHAWPAVLVIIGITMLIRRDTQGHGHFGFWGTVCIFGGLWAYAAQRDWIHVNFWAVFGPTLLILLGGAFVYRAFYHPRPEGSTNESYIHSFAVMSGNELKPTSTPFKGADLGSVMGGIVLDLTGAQMEGDTATVDVFTIMGGIEIFVPRDWNVSTKVVSFMGACVDKRRPATMPATKTLVVRGFAFLGGIDIKD
jgi:cell wall-active antibiotic response 4TMS protein YvqF